METSDSSDKRGTSGNASPSVSKDKWIRHALQKLSKGYILIVGNGKRTANFFKPGMGYEMCAYHVALHLVRTQLVAESHTHYLGTAYALTPEGQALLAGAPPKRKTRVVHDDDEDDDASLPIALSDAEETLDVDEADDETEDIEEEEDAYGEDDVDEEEFD